MSLTASVKGGKSPSKSCWLPLAASSRVVVVVELSVMKWFEVDDARRTGARCGVVELQVKEMSRRGGRRPGSLETLNDMESFKLSRVDWSWLFG